MIDLMTVPRPVASASAERMVGYFFALDTDGRIAWPFRCLRDGGGDIVAQRWRFGHWVDSREAARFLSGEDDLYTAAQPADVDAWIARQGRTSGLRLAPPRAPVAAV